MSFDTNLFICIEVNERFRVGNSYYNSKKYPQGKFALAAR